MALTRQWVQICLMIGMLFLWGGYAAARPGNLCSMATETTFIEFPSVDISDGSVLSVKGKLKIPVRHNNQGHNKSPRNKFAAVVILHGSSGVDFRGDFYARGLNEAGIATLEIDMWEARGIQSASEQPPLPIFTYPDAFAALKYLSEHPDIDPAKIGVLGFSWGGVITMAAATETYAAQFGGDLRFAAHVAHYPLCFCYNTPGFAGLEFTQLTGAPILVQIGEEDDYDEGSEPCYALRSSLNEQFQGLIDIKAYEGAYHGFDRLQVPTTIEDPFSHRGQGLEEEGCGEGGCKVEIIPNPQAAYEARLNAVRFFQRNLTP